MPQPKQYPHEKLLNRLKSEDPDFEIEDLDDESLIERIDSFRTKRSLIKGLSPDLINESEEIADDLTDYIDQNYEEDDDTEEGESHSSIVETSKRNNNQEPTKPEITIPTPDNEKFPPLPPVSIVKNLSKEEIALEKLFKAGRKVNISEKELENAGFKTGFWSNLSSTGYKGKSYMLKKAITESTYQLVKL